MTTSRINRFWRFIHNVVAHPLMEVLPVRLGNRLHEQTARLAFQQEAPTV